MEAREASPAFKVRSLKKPTNVSINRAVLEKAKSLGLNISQIAEQALIAQIRQQEERAFVLENQAAMASYNEWIDKNGLWSESLRQQVWASLASEDNA